LRISVIFLQCVEQNGINLLKQVASKTSVISTYWPCDVTAVEELWRSLHAEPVLICRRKLTESLAWGSCI